MKFKMLIFGESIMCNLLKLECIYLRKIFYFSFKEEVPCLAKPGGVPRGAPTLLHSYTPMLGLMID